MRHYKEPADAAFGAVLLLSAAVCTTIIVATLGYQITCRIVFPESDLHFPSLWPAHLPYLAMLAAVFLVRRQLFSSSVRVWAYVALCCATVLALWFSFMWFRHPMHDIALFFNSHGRWGCAVINDDGTRVHFIRDDTVPWLLFAPVAISAAAHWIWTKNRRAQNKKLENIGTTAPNPQH